MDFHRLACGWLRKCGVDGFRRDHGCGYVCRGDDGRDGDFRRDCVRGCEYVCRGDDDCDGDFRRDCGYVRRDCVCVRGRCDRGRRRDRDRDDDLRCAHGYDRD